MEEEEIIAYSICNILEELEYIGIINRTTVNSIYNTLGNTILPSLLPKRLISPFVQPERSQQMANVTADHKGLILYRKAGSFIDPKYLEWAKEHYPTMFGCAFGQEGSMIYSAQNGDIQITDGEQSLQSVQAAFKDCPMIFYFGKSSVDFKDEDMQPFVLIDDGSEDHQPIIMAALDGDLEDYIRDEMPHSAAYYAVEEYLKEEIKSIYEQQSGDLEKVRAVLTTPLVSKRMKNMLGKGYLAIILTNGDIIEYDYATNSAEFGWGKTSNVGDFRVTESKAGESPTGEKTKRVHMSLQEKLKAVAAETKETSKVETKPETKEDRVTVGSNGERDIVVPAQFLKTDKGHQNVKGLQSWLFRHFEWPKNKNGNPQLPDNWASLKGIPYKQLKANSPLKDRLKTLEAIGPALEETKKQVTTEILPVVSPQERDEVVKKILSQFSVDSDKLWDWDKIKKIDESSPNWNEQLAIPLSLMCKVPHTVFWQLISHYPKTAYALIYSMRNLIAEYLSSDIDGDLEDFKKELANKGSDKKQAAM